MAETEPPAATQNQRIRHHGRPRLNKAKSAGAGGGRFKQVDTGGVTNHLWRYGIEHTERLPFAGPACGARLAPRPRPSAGTRSFRESVPNAGVVVDIATTSGGDNLTMYIATANGGDTKLRQWRRILAATHRFPPQQRRLRGGHAPAIRISCMPGPNLFEASGVPKSTGLFSPFDGGATRAIWTAGLHATAFATHGINRASLPCCTILAGTDIGLLSLSPPLSPPPPPLPLSLQRWRPQLRR